MAYTAAIPTWQIFAGLVKEATWGTAVNPQTTFFPIKAPKLDVKYESIFDDGYRGNASQDFAYYQGTGSTTVDFPGMYFYPEASGNLLMAMLGADAITGTVAPYTHKITLLNSALRPSYTVSVFDGAVTTARQVAGCVFDQVSLKFSNPGMLTVDAKGMGKIATNATKSTNLYDSGSPFIPWQAALTLGGTADLTLVDFSLDLKSNVSLLYGVNNSQDASNFVSEPLEVSGKMTFDSSDYTELNEYLNNSQPSVSILFTSGTNTLTIQMSKCAFIDPTTLDHSKPQLETTASFRAIANSTDAGTGNAPIQFSLVNGQATSY